MPIRLCCVNIFHSHVRMFRDYLQLHKYKVKGCTTHCGYSDLLYSTLSYFMLLLLYYYFSFIEKRAPSLPLISVWGGAGGELSSIASLCVWLHDCESYCLYICASPVGLCIHVSAMWTCRIHIPPCRYLFVWLVLSTKFHRFVILFEMYKRRPWVHLSFSLMCTSCL